MANLGRRARAEINITALNENTIIAAPTNGHIQIDHISLVPTGGANTIAFRDGTGSGNNMFEIAFDDNQSYVFDNASGDYPLTLTEATAFILNLSAGSQVSGVVLFRVVGEA